MSSQFLTGRAALEFTSGRVDWAVVCRALAHLGQSAHDCATPFQKWTMRAMHPPATVREYVAAGKY